MEGFAPVSLQQLAAADRELHIRLAEMTRAGFKPGPAGELPLDLPTNQVLEGPELRWMLMPVPKRSVAKAPPETPKLTKPVQEVDSKRNRVETAKEEQAGSIEIEEAQKGPPCRSSSQVAHPVTTKAMLIALHSTLGPVQVPQIAQRESTCAARKDVERNMPTSQPTSRGRD